MRPSGAEASTSKWSHAALARPWQEFSTQLSEGCPLLQPGKGRLNPSYPLPSPFFTSHWLLICPAWLEGDRWECWPSRVSGELQTTRGLGLIPSPTSCAGKSLGDYHKEPLQYSKYLSLLLSSWGHRVLVALLTRDLCFRRESKAEELLNFSDLEIMSNRNP